MKRMRGHSQLGGGRGESEKNEMPLAIQSGYPYAKGGDKRGPSKLCSGCAGTGRKKPTRDDIRRRNGSASAGGGRRMRNVEDKGQGGEEEITMR